MSNTKPKIPHGNRCSRPAPVLRVSWQGTPELFCSGCGRSVAVPQHDEEVAR